MTVKPLRTKSIILQKPYITSHSKKYRSSLSSKSHSSSTRFQVSRLQLATLLSSNRPTKSSSNTPRRTSASKTKTLWNGTEAPSSRHRLSATLWQQQSLQFNRMAARRLIYSRSIASSSRHNSRLIWISWIRLTNSSLLWARCRSLLTRRLGIWRPSSSCCSSNRCNNTCRWSPNRRSTLGNPTRCQILRRWWFLSTRSQTTVVNLSDKCSPRTWLQVMHNIRLLKKKRNLKVRKLMELTGRINHN